MSKKSKLINRIGANPAGVRYEDACKMFFDSRDQTWVAISDDLPGCSAGGDTPQEALQEFEIAVEAWVQALKAMGQPIPQPVS